METENVVKVYCKRCNKFIEERQRKRAPFFVISGDKFMEGTTSYVLCGDCQEELTTPTLQELNEYDELLETH